MSLLRLTAWTPQMQVSAPREPVFSGYKAVIHRSFYNLIHLSINSSGLLIKSTSTHYALSHRHQEAPSLSYLLLISNIRWEHQRQIILVCANKIKNMSQQRRRMYHDNNKKKKITVYNSDNVRDCSYSL